MNRSRISGWLSRQTIALMPSWSAGRLCRDGLLPSKPKFRSDRRDGVTVQYLSRAGENNRFLNLDVVGIELLETRGLGEQLLYFF